jgi:ribosomal protein S18 acetylase RimI-like enzyme
MRRELNVRRATLADAAVVAQLFSEFNALLGADGLPDALAFAPENINVTQEQMARRLQAIEGVEHVWLAELDGEPSGLACLRLVPYIGQDAPYAELTQLYVRGRFQRLGVGRILTEAVERYAAAAGATCVLIMTANKNGTAQAFYQSAGYESNGMVFTKYLNGVPNKSEVAHV